MYQVYYHRVGTIEDHLKSMTSLLLRHNYSMENTLTNIVEIIDMQTKKIAQIKGFQQNSYEKIVEGTLDSVITVYTNNGKIGQANYDSIMSIFGPNEVYEMFKDKILPISGLIK